MSEPCIEFARQLFHSPLSSAQEPEPSVPAVAAGSLGKKVTEDLFYASEAECVQEEADQPVRRKPAGNHKPKVFKKPAASTAPSGVLKRPAACKREVAADQEENDPEANRPWKVGCCQDVSIFYSSCVRSIRLFYTHSSPKMAKVRS